MLRGSIDKQALERARDGGRGALRFLYLRNEATVRRGLVDVLDDEELAEDMTQALFAEVSGDGGGEPAAGGTGPTSVPRASASPCGAAASG
jgi:hypothetical protein